MIDYYLLIVHGDVMPEITGAYANQDARDDEAYKYRHKTDPEGKDGIFALDISFGKKPSVYAYSGRFFDEPR
jgi:hypothetical protein